MKYSIIFFSLLLSIIFVGCTEKSDPVSANQDHFTAYGVVILESGVEILHYFKGELDTGKDTLIVPVGLSAHWELKFLDVNENIIEPPTDANHVFRCQFIDTSIVNLYQHDGQVWQFHFNGKKVGETSVEFQVYHVDHLDFHTLKIPVSVRNIDGAHGAPVGVRLYDEESGNLLSQASLLATNTFTDTLFFAN